MPGNDESFYCLLTDSWSMLRLLDTHARAMRNVLEAFTDMLYGRPKRAVRDTTVCDIPSP